MQTSMGRSLVAGLSGAAALTLVHEAGRRLSGQAPRIDKVGKRALARTLKTLDLPVPRGKKLYRAALWGDLLSNGLFYGIGLGASRRPIMRGAVLGAVAGLGALSVAPMLGFGILPLHKSPQTRGMTIGWYVLGGIVAGMVFKLGRRREA